VGSALSWLRSLTNAPGKGARHQTAAELARLTYSEVPRLAQMVGWRKSGDFELLSLAKHFGRAILFTDWSYLMSSPHDPYSKNCILLKIYSPL
jgi:hypothetical protein